MQAAQGYLPHVYGLQDLLDADKVLQKGQLGESSDTDSVVGWLLTKLRTIASIPLEVCAFPRSIRLQLQPPLAANVCVRTHLCAIRLRDRTLQPGLCGHAKSAIHIQ